MPPHPVPAPLPLIHFAEDGDTSGYFPALAKYHDRSRYAMTFGTLRQTEPTLDAFMTAQGVATFSCGAAGRLSYGRALMSLVRRLRSQPCAAFHAHLFDPSVVGLTAARIAAVPARILTRHYSNYHTRIRRPVHVKLDQWCTASAHHVIAVSRETAEHLIRVEGAPESKVSTIHNGIDFERVRPTGPDSRERVRRELGLGDTFTFLIAGRLHPEKGYEFLFEAVRRVLREAPRRFVLLVAGRGPLLDHYRSLASGLGIAEHVRFLGFRQDLPDLMTACDVFVLPSVAESFGLVLAEALYLGAPVLASRVGGIPEIVTDGLDGRLVEPGDAAALAKAMEAFLRGSVALPGRGEAARAKIRQRFSFERMLRSYEAVYEQVLAGRR